MKVFLIIFFLIVSGVTSGQDMLLRKKIDSIVLRIDKQKGKIERFRWLLGYYEYKKIDSTIIKMIHSYKSGSSNIEQVFYINKKLGLLFSTEKEVTYYEKDSIIWAGKYYFHKGKLADYETLGHGKSETEEWNPEKEVLKNYKESLRKVKEYSKKKI